MKSRSPSHVAAVRDPLTGDIQFVEVESARGGGLIYAATAALGQIIAGAEDRAAMRILAHEAQQLIEQESAKRLDWVVRDLPQAGDEQGLVLSDITDDDGSCVGWCVRGLNGDWHSEPSADLVQIKDFLESMREELRHKPPGT